MSRRQGRAGEGGDAPYRKRDALACELLGAVIEKRDDGASRIERDGQSWFRVAVTAKTIMTSLGPLTYRRARYRSGASGASPVPVDESLGLVDDYLTRPAAELGLLMMGHFSPRLDHDKQCMCVIIGADELGRKELLAIADGYRESAQSWREVLLDLKRRGLAIAPELATGDGALGFWKALREV